MQNTWEMVLSSLRRASGERVRIDEETTEIAKLAGEAIGKLLVVSGRIYDQDQVRLLEEVEENIERISVRCGSLAIAVNMLNRRLGQ